MVKYIPFDAVILYCNLLRHEQHPFHPQGTTVSRFPFTLPHSIVSSSDLSLYRESSGGDGEPGIELDEDGDLVVRRKQQHESLVLLIGILYFTWCIWHIIYCRVFG